MPTAYCVLRPSGLISFPRNNSMACAYLECWRLHPIIALIWHLVIPRSCLGTGLSNFQYSFPKGATASHKKSWALTRICLVYESGAWAFNPNFPLQNNEILKCFPLRGIKCSTFKVLFWSSFHLQFLFMSDFWDGPQKAFFTIRWKLRRRWAFFRQKQWKIYYYHFYYERELFSDL